LGLDHEFLESVLVPQVMLYGFLGLHPTGDGFSLDPSLPGEWPSLEVTGIHVQDHVIDVTAYQDGRAEIRCRRAGARPLRIYGEGIPPAGLQLIAGQSIMLKP
jgi:hypothetical protein